MNSTITLYSHNRTLCDYNASICVVLVFKRWCSSAERNERIYGCRSVTPTSESYRLGIIYLLERSTQHKHHYLVRERIHQHKHTYVFIDIKLYSSFLLWFQTPSYRIHNVSIHLKSPAFVSCWLFASWREIWDDAMGVVNAEYQAPYNQHYSWKVANPESEKLDTCVIVIVIFIIKCLKFDIPNNYVLQKTHFSF